MNKAFNLFLIITGVIATTGNIVDIITTYPNYHGAMALTVITAFMTMVCIAIRPEL